MIHYVPFLNAHREAPNIIYRSAFRGINIRKGRQQDEGRSFKPLILGCACFVPERGQNIYLPFSKKKQAGRETKLGFLVNGDAVHAERGRLGDSAAHLATNAMTTQNR